MSTRCTTHLVYKGETKPTAIIYRHSDGYPEGHGTDLLRFLREVKENVADTRFSDPSYLAAKLVVWLARMFVRDYDTAGWSSITREDYERTFGKPHPLNFLSVGVVSEDPGDIEYRYVIECGDCTLPKVRCIELNRWSTKVETEVPIPEPADD